MTTDAKKRFLINAVFVVVILAIIYLSLKYLLIWLMPFVIGFICALVLQRPVAFLSKKTRIPRGVWATVLVILVLGAFFGLLVGIGYRLYDQAVSLVAGLSKFLPDVKAAFSNVSDRFVGLTNNVPKAFAEAIRSAPEKLASSGIDILSKALPQLATAIIGNIPSLLLSTVISIVACCFITIDYYKITDFILCQFSVRAQKLLLKSKRVFIENILKMGRGYAIIICITFVELLLGFWILDIPYAVVLALVIAIIDILPVLGTGTVLIPWGVIALLTGKTFVGLGMLVLYAAITVIRNIIEPKIIGNQVGLPAIVTLIAMYLGLKLFGFVGLWGLPILLIIVVKLQESGMIRIWKTGTNIAGTITD